MNKSEAIDNLDTDTAAELRAENQRLRDALELIEQHPLADNAVQKIAGEALAGDGE